MKKDFNDFSESKLNRTELKYVLGGISDEPGIPPILQWPPKPQGPITSPGSAGG